MTNCPSFDYEGFIAQLHNEAQTPYANFNLGVEVYSSRLTSLVKRNLGENYQDKDAIDFLRRTHTADLYLTIACAEKIELAWKRLIESYGSFIYRLAKFYCSNAAAADEVASNVIADLFMPGRSNLPRIASYDGRIPLTGWLRSIVLNRARDERELKWNSVERLDDQPDIADSGSMARIEASRRAGRYRLMILSALNGAGQRLTDRELYILQMTCGESIQIKEVARTLGVHPSRVTKQLKEVRGKIIQQVRTILEQEHKLCKEAIRECLAEIVENPEYSLLDSLRATG